MKQVFDTMSEATGVDFTESMRAGTYDAKVIRKIELSGAESLVKDADAGKDDAGSSAEGGEDASPEEV